MTIKELLVCARDLIKDPERFTQNAYARDSKGRTTTPKSSDAVCWCSVGAILKCQPSGLTLATAEDAINHLERAAKGNKLTYVNDRLGHEAVLNLFNDAIEALPCENQA